MSQKRPSQASLARKQSSPQQAPVQQAQAPMPQPGQEMSPGPVVAQQPTQYGQPMMAPQPVQYAQPMMAPQPVAYGQPVMAAQPMPYGQPMMASPPVMMAPGQIMMATPVPRPPGCPPGLELLTMVNQLIVEQQIEMLEVLTGFETNNRYRVRNILGHQMYYAVEENDCCTLSCCGPNRPFEMRILDNYGQQVARIHRPYGCNFIGMPCCPHEITVTAPPGTAIGYTRQNCACCTPDFDILNEAGQLVFTIVGPCEMCLVGAASFPVYATDRRTQIGVIQKKWGGFAKEWYTKADTFGVSFPVDLDVKLKAVLLGTTFLIDYMYFENEPPASQQRHHHHHHHDY